MALSLLPISELRGAIPFALAGGLSIPAAYLLCVSANALVAPLLYLFLATLHRLLSRLAPYRRLFDRLVSHARERVKGTVERYGYAGLALFVAIPLPVTGAYTGALGAWILGMKPRKVFLSALAGVAVSGAIVTAVWTLGVHAFFIFVKPAA